jgi:hypothetical protein
VRAVDSLLEIDFDLRISIVGIALAVERLQSVFTLRVIIADNLVDRI